MFDLLVVLFQVLDEFAKIALTGSDMQDTNKYIVNPPCQLKSDVAVGQSRRCNSAVTWTLKSRLLEFGVAAFALATRIYLSWNY